MMASYEKTPNHRRSDFGVARAGSAVRGRRRRSRLHDAGTTADSDAERQARARTAGLRGHPAVPAAARQSGRRHADHLR